MQTHLDPAHPEIGRIDANEQFNQDHKNKDPQEEKIRKRAFQIYEAHGREEGHALSHWLQAKAEVKSESKNLKAA
jgi:hypothetical protein